MMLIKVLATQSSGGHRAMQKKQEKGKVGVS